MDDILIYILNNIKLKDPFCRLRLLAENYKKNFEPVNQNLIKVTNVLKQAKKKTCTKLWVPQ